MDIKVSEKSLRKFLKTSAKIETIIEHLCNSGPTVDRYHKQKGDTQMEIEIITNRIDSASVFGLAREANTILNQNKIKSTLTNNPYLLKLPNFKSQTEKLNFKIADSKLVRRFTAISLSNVTVKDSPQDVKEFLIDSDQRPINNLVDATNEFTLLYGVPSHVFDKDKLSLQNLTIREAKKGESLITLDGTKINLLDGDIIIEDGLGKLVDLCGVMGGQSAVVDQHTKNIILIVPFYNPQKIRKTSLFHQKRTLAAQIYEKGPDPEICLPVLNLLINALLKRAGGKVTSKVFDFQPNKFKSKQVNIKLSWLNNFAGLKINKSEVVSILKNLGFTQTKINDDILSTSVPSFRHEDINTREDLAEEIIRVFGYFNIPSTLPPLHKTPTPTDTIFALERHIKTILAVEGFNEIYNSSLISKQLIEICNLKPDEHLKLKNCLSEDLEFLRTSLVPSCLQNHFNNKGKNILPLKLFELANIYLPQKSGELPNEVSTLVISTDLDLLKLKSVLEKLFNLLNYPLYEFAQPNLKKTEYLNTQNSADIIVNNEIIGQIGEVKSSISKRIGLTNIISVVELNISKLNKILPIIKFTPISNYPSLKEDVTITTTKPIGEIIREIYNLDKNIKKVNYKNTYKNNHTFEIIIESLTQNLTQETADDIRQKILNL